ncbi:MAG: DUF1223 domain-containing protein [Candidatus Omnitrophica bacterium]|nr:DUF1223 domain-containing protein [Candidatus Omnitrophota bacterium]
MKAIVLSGAVLMMLVSSAWAARPFAVVELFSSEGCSSCPPADELFREITLKAKEKSQRVYTLAFQVDSWNYLGWKDPFSKYEFTERQQRYAQAMGATSTYTPQMVVNGQEAFVGSDRVQAEKTVGKYLQTPAENSLFLRIHNAESGMLEVSYVCEQISKDAVINVALVESGLESRITAGENAGRVIKHDHVVRELRTVPLERRTGVVVLSKPAGHLGKYEIIAYIQNQKNMHIFAVDRIALK